MRSPTVAIAAALALILAGAPAPAAELEGAGLVVDLRSGGYTLYFRHAATDWTQSDRIERPGDWQSCEPGRARQLSEAGRAAARRMGEAIRRLALPIGRVLSSEYCRAAETARLMGIGPVETTPAIMNMRVADLVGGAEAVVARARQELVRPPRAGTNTVIVGHGNLMRAATGAYVEEGGAGIFRAGANGRVRVIALLAPADWQGLAERFGNSAPSTR